MCGSGMANGWRVAIVVRGMEHDGMMTKRTIQARSAARWVMIFAAISLTGCGEQAESGDAPASPTHSMTVTATAYTASRRETDSTPYTTAFNEKLRMDDRIIAVSRDLEKMGLTHNTLVRIEGRDGVYRVGDRTHKRWRKRIDIFMGKDRKRALKWGKRKVTIHWPVER